MDEERAKKLEMGVHIFAIFVGPVTGLIAKLSGKSGTYALLAITAIGITALAGSELLRRIRSLARIESSTKKIEDRVAAIAPIGDTASQIATSVGDIQSRIANLERLGEDRVGAITRINDLAQVYEMAARMIAGARSEVCDTTWGHEKEADNLSPQTIAARGHYRAAVEAACERDPAIVFKDIFGLGSGARKARLLEAIALRDRLKKRKRETHKIRLAPVPTTAPVMDLLIVDQTEVLLTADKKEYCHLKGSAIATMLQAYFNANWENQSTMRVEVRDGKLCDPSGKEIGGWTG